MLVQQAIAPPSTAADPAERLAALFDMHHQRLYRLGLRMLGDVEEARELVQETFLRAARSPRRVPLDAPAAEAWLVRVAVNCCHDRRRRLAVRRAHHGELPADVVAPDQEGGSIARSVLHTALQRLPARRRAVLVLHELEGLTAGEVGRLLGVSAVTVRWHLATGRRELARQLTGEVAGRREETTP